VGQAWEAALNEYLQHHARKNHDNAVAKTWVATPDGETILGFYSLSPASVACERAPEVLSPTSGKYDIATFHLGRLAVDRRYQGQGLGGMLLGAAARGCIRAAAEVGGSMLPIDAKNRARSGVV
jgi:GNAT superfamily N-acetyltransferase